MILPCLHRTQLGVRTCLAAAAVVAACWPGYALHNQPNTLRGTLCPTETSMIDVQLENRDQVLADLVVDEHGVVNRVPLLQVNASLMLWEPVLLPMYMRTVSVSGVDDCEAQAVRGFYSTSCGLRVDVAELEISAHGFAPKSTSVFTPYPGTALPCYAGHGQSVSSLYAQPPKRESRSLLSMSRRLRQGAESQLSTGEIRVLIVAVLWPGADEQPNHDGRTWPQVRDFIEPIFREAIDLLNADSLGAMQMTYTMADRFYNVSGDTYSDIGNDLTSQLQEAGLYRVPNAPYDWVSMVHPYYQSSYAARSTIAYTPGNFQWYNGLRYLAPSDTNGNVGVGLVYHEVGHALRLNHDFAHRAGYYVDYGFSGGAYHDRMGYGGTYDTFIGGQKVTMRWMPLSVVGHFQPAGPVGYSCETCTTGGVFTTVTSNTRELPPGVAAQREPFNTASQRRYIMAMRSFLAPEESKGYSPYYTFPSEMWASLRTNLSLGYVPNTGRGFDVYRMYQAYSVPAYPFLADFTPTTPTTRVSIGDSDAAQYSAGRVVGVPYRLFMRGAWRDPEYATMPWILETFGRHVADAIIPASSGVLQQPVFINGTVSRSRYVHPQGVPLEGLGCSAQGCEKFAGPSASEVVLDTTYRTIIEADMPLQHPHPLPRPWFTLAAQAESANGGSLAEIILCDEDEGDLPEHVTFWLAVSDSTPWPVEQAYYGAEAGSGALAMPESMGDGYYSQRARSASSAACGSGRVLAAIPVVVPIGEASEALHVIAGVQPKALRKNEDLLPGTDKVPFPAWDTSVPTRRIRIVAAMKTTTPGIAVSMRNVRDASNTRLAYGYWIEYLPVQQFTGMEYNGKPIYSWAGMYIVWDSTGNRWRFTYPGSSDLTNWVPDVAGPVGVTDFWAIDVFKNPQDESDVTAEFGVACQLGTKLAGSSTTMCEACGGGASTLYPRVGNPYTCDDNCPAGQTTPVRVYGYDSAQITEANKCQSCPVGTFKTGAGLHGCTACPVNQTTNSAGTTASNFCYDQIGGDNTIDPWDGNWDPLHPVAGGVANPDNYWASQMNLYTPFAIARTAPEGLSLCKYLVVESSQFAADTGIWQLLEEVNPMTYEHTGNQRRMVRSGSNGVYTYGGNVPIPMMVPYSGSDDAITSFFQGIVDDEITIDCMCMGNEPTTYIDPLGIERTACACPPGKSEVNGSCSLCVDSPLCTDNTCPENTYADGSGSCQSCPANSVSPPSSYSIDQCRCKLGYSGSAATGCTATAACTGIGLYMCPNEHCVETADGFDCGCPDHSVSLPGEKQYDEAECRPCSEGFYYDDGTCKACAYPLMSPRDASQGDCVCPGNGLYSATLGACLPPSAVTVALNGAGTADLPDYVAGQLPFVGVDAPGTDSDAEPGWYTMRRLRGTLFTPRYLRHLSHSSMPNVEPADPNNVPSIMASNIAPLMRWTVRGGGRWVLTPDATGNVEGMYYAQGAGYAGSLYNPVVAPPASGDQQLDPWSVYSYEFGGPLPTDAFELSAQHDGQLCDVALADYGYECPVGTYRAQSCSEAWQADVGVTGVADWQAAHCTLCSSCAAGEHLVQACTVYADAVCAADSELQVGSECAVSGGTCPAGHQCTDVSTTTLAGAPYISGEQYRCLPEELSAPGANFMWSAVRAPICVPVSQNLTMVDQLQHVWEGILLNNVGIPGLRWQDFYPVYSTSREGSEPCPSGSLSRELIYMQVLDLQYILRFVEYADLEWAFYQVDSAHDYTAANAQSPLAPWTSLYARYDGTTNAFLTSLNATYPSSDWPRPGSEAVIIAGKGSPDVSPSPVATPSSTSTPVPSATVTTSPNSTSAIAPSATQSSSSSTTPTCSAEASTMVEPAPSNEATASATAVATVSPAAVSSTASPPAATVTPSSTPGATAIWPVPAVPGSDLMDSNDVVINSNSATNSTSQALGDGGGMDAVAVVFTVLGSVGLLIIIMGGIAFYRQHMSDGAIAGFMSPTGRTPHV